MPQTYPPLVAPKRLLFGPGPSLVAPRVYQAMAQNVVGHLDPFFFEIAGEMHSLLADVFSTSNPFTRALSGTGSSGMEAAVVNFVEPASRFALLSNGLFAERIGEMARRQGANVVRLAKEWGEPFDPQEVRDFLRRERPAVVAFVHAETSTGMLNHAAPICQAAREIDALTIADCVTSLGGMPVMVDQNGIDIAYSCTQKALACPPGLAPITVSPRALERLAKRTAPIPSWYLDLQLINDCYTHRRFHHTQSATLYFALRESLAMIAEEGLENRWERHRRNHLAFVAGLEAMGLEMFVRQPRDRLWTLNLPLVPPGIDEARLRRDLLAHHSIEISGGFGPLAGKVFRIGLMGYGSARENLFVLLEAFESELKRQGFQPAGDARAAAERALA